jgi:hypothetical protein
VKRLLSIATLYPNAHRPRFGPFAARQVEALAACAVPFNGRRTRRRWWTYYEALLVRR